jgi:hypothetical protein
MKKISFIRMGLAALLALGTTSAFAEGDEWTFGLGTGIQRLNAKGDVGFTSFRGPELGELDLSPSDVSDLMDSAFGLQGFASKDRWQFRFKYGYLDLQDKAQIDLINGALPLTADFRQEITAGRITAVYNFAETGNSQWGVLGGVNYTRHKYDVRISTGNLTRKRKIDEDWTDVLVGLTHTMPLTDTITWRTSAITGFGDTDSYWSMNTAVDWQFARSWNVGIFIDYTEVDFENGNPGDNDWYLYDADEWGPGISIMYVF